MVMPVVCAQCGEANPAGIVACGRCGAALSPDHEPFVGGPHIIRRLAHAALPVEVARTAETPQVDSAASVATMAAPETEAEQETESALLARADPANRTAPLVRAAAPIPPGMTAETAPTEILPFDAETLHVLPVGAVLARRFITSTVVRPGTGTNVYRARPLDQQMCGTCAAVLPVEAPACPRCGATLSGITPHPAYWVTESFLPEPSLAGPAAATHPLVHAHILPVAAQFEYTPYGHPRTYIAAEAREGQLLDELPAGQPAARIVTLGLQLSDALAYLHNHGILSPGMSASNVLVHKGEAFLLNLQEARAAPEDAGARAEAVASDVARLAGTLYEALTGQYAEAAGQGPLLPPTAPPELLAAFTRALQPAPDDPPLTAPAWHALLQTALPTVQVDAPSIRIRSGRVSDVGRRRPLNEDSLSAIECQVIQESVSAALGVYAVADGMGGHAGGEIASAMAIAAVTDRLLRHFITPQFSADAADPTAEDILDWLVGAVQTANELIYAERARRGTDMGTTLVVALVTGAKAYIANVGDSRAYLLRAGDDGAPVLAQISVDHSLVQHLVELGQITEEEAKYHPFRNMIYKSLGERDEVEIDTFIHPLAPGTRLLICSDGLSGMVPDDRIRAVLAGTSDPQVACEELVAAANAAGGVDNITAIAIFIEAG